MDHPYTETTFHGLIQIEYHRDHWKAHLIGFPDTVETGDSAPSVVGKVVTKHPAEIAAALFTRVYDFGYTLTAEEEAAFRTRVIYALTHGGKVREFDLKTPLVAPS